MGWRERSTPLVSAAQASRRVAICRPFCGGIGFTFCGLVRVRVGVEIK